MQGRPKDDFQIGSSIPVLRMFDEAKARAFYLDFLGYQVDWAHRFDPQNPASPLYMQVSQGRSVIHLNGHADETVPAAEVRIPVERLDEYCAFLRARAVRGEKPEIVDPRYRGRNTDMNIRDPFGNLLVFWRAARDK